MWPYAYEQQISDAGRSLLLTMSSFGGKAGDALLREGFAALHAQRAQKYGLQRNPKDYATARAELHGAFVSPSRVDTIEFINPSVQDWLNRVVRTEPDNAVDLMVGAVRLTQIAQIWNFVQSAVGGATRDALRNNIGQIAPNWRLRSAPSRTPRASSTTPRPMKSGLPRRSVWGQQDASAIECLCDWLENVWRGSEPCEFYALSALGNLLGGRWNREAATLTPLPSELRLRLANLVHDIVRLADDEPSREGMQTVTPRREMEDVRRLVENYLGADYSPAGRDLSPVTEERVPLNFMSLSMLLQ